MKNWWEEDEEFDLDGKGEDSFEAKKNEDDKNFEEVFGASFGDMPLRQQLETAYDYYEKPKSEKTDQIAESNCVMTFDGQNLGLFKNGRLQDHLDGQSGQDGFQSSGYQNVKDKGPIPEGRYYVNQKERQTITPWDAGWGTLAPMLKKINPSARGGKWQGGPVAWGTRRAWLRPDKKTNTFGRTGFSIHGGWNKGSAGCIDIPWQTGKLSSYLDGCQESVPLDVKYPKYW